MRFRYAFQKIVDLKTNEKTQAEWVLSSAVGHLKSEEETLQSLHSEKEDVHNLLNNSASVTTTVSQLMVYQQYLEHLDQQIENKVHAVYSAQRNVEEKQERLTVKMVEEKVWNKAREKAFRNHSALVLKKEQEALDEMAVTRHKRSS